jgi:hypothetical protein
MKRKDAVAIIERVMGNPTDMTVGQAKSLAERIMVELELSGIGPEPRYISSGCMHSSWEGCSCSGSYETGWEK